MEEDIFKQLVAEKFNGAEPKEPLAEEPQTTETVEEVAEEPTDITEPPVTQEEIVNKEPEEPKTAEKQKIDYTQWLTENEDTIKKYLNEKDKDYSKLPSEQLAEMKIRKENPHFSDQDIKEELSEKYGIGLEKLSENIADYEDFDEDEAKELIKEAKIHNKNLAKLQRELKKDAPSFASEFEEAKSNISLPEFEIEAPKIEQQKPLTIEEQYEEIQKQAEVYKNEQWIPQLKQAIDSFESIQEEVEYEDNGNKVVLNVDYKLSETDKKGFLEDYGDYIVTVKDQENYQTLEGFLKDKVRSKVVTKLLTTVAKESAARARESFVKNNLLNYDDSNKRQYVPQGELSFAEKLLTIPVQKK